MEETATKPIAATEEKKTVELKEKFYGEKDAKRIRLTVGGTAWNATIDRIALVFLQSQFDMKTAQELLTELHFAQGREKNKDGNLINTSTLETLETVQKLTYKQAASNMPDILEKVKAYATDNKIDGIVNTTTETRTVTTTTVDMEIAKEIAKTDPKMAIILSGIEYKETTSFSAPKLKIK